MGVASVFPAAAVLPQFVAQFSQIIGGAAGAYISHWTNAIPSVQVQEEEHHKYNLELSNFIIKLII